MRWFFVQICRLLLRIFFRSVEVIGQDRIPSQGLLLFALNHHNALIDPLFLICLKDRKVSFLTKEPLFRMPVVGWFVRAFESVPVYRAQDGADPQKNRAMLDAARQLLKQGNAIA
ncbi:MAG TPA: 1-acyl-sn-glycerol-3-phosphate acyltransferase, partial [Polyangiaceae bacterium]|nr:1-acyl-sn-glycerol-3-phosphate acyltransferase [Polyangiaceae bacterium]